ncbi:hypothetical protein ABZN20_05290 [Methylococcus sp. ANG]|uniref:hypothetical protein n=1 Tax=Methylococcus sp. ANG TaxID=3231903 RepID=UPI00345ABB4D
MLLSGSVLTGCVTPVPNDGAAAAPQRWDDLRDLRYCEIFLIGGNPVTRNLQGAVYNTSFLNDPKDSCPDAAWVKVDPESLKRQYDVLGIFKNGPRYWTNDWVYTPIGAEQSFNGLKARWVTEVSLPRDIEVGRKGSTAYKPTTVARNSEMGFEKGKAVFILQDPDGMPWVMKSYSLTVDPNLKYADLQALGHRLKLPSGWRYRTRILDQDLTIRAVKGVARIVQDDLENTYDACFETACSYKP